MYYWKLFQNIIPIRFFICYYYVIIIDDSDVCILTLFFISFSRHVLSSILQIVRAATAFSFNFFQGAYHNGNLI